MNRRALFSTVAVAALIVTGLATGNAPLNRQDGILVAAVAALLAAAWKDE